MVASRSSYVPEQPVVAAGAPPPPKLTESDATTDMTTPLRLLRFGAESPEPRERKNFVQQSPVCMGVAAVL